MVWDHDSGTIGEAEQFGERAKRRRVPAGPNLDGLAALARGGKAHLRDSGDFAVRARVRRMRSAGEVRDRERSVGVQEEPGEDFTLRV